MQVVVNLIIKFFAITLLGLGLKKSGLISISLEKGLNSLLLKVILPLSILVSSQSTYTREAVTNMLLTAGIAGIYYIVAVVFSNLVSKIIGMKGSKKAIFIAATVFGNVGFIGFPVASELYGSEGLLYAIVYNIFFQLFFFTYGTTIISGKKQFDLMHLVKNPVLICSLLSIFLFIFQVPIQTGLAEAMRSVGNMTAPISLILIGCNLSDVKLMEIITDKHSYFISTIRMLVYPLGFFLLMILLGLPTIVAGTSAVLTALPSGSLTVIYAQEYDCEPKFASRAIIQTMLIMAITLPIMLILVNIYL